MQIKADGAQSLRDELLLMQEILPLDGAHLLELGCGRAEKVRKLAELSKVTAVVAAEVDAHAHAENLRNPAAKVTFAHFGAEQIEAADNTFDVVMMLKSLHHVPATLMDTAFDEIARVLKPGGLVYLSEPVFAGKFNEIIRLFHDEEQVREQAFAATVRAASSPRFELVAQHFFHAEVKLKSFAQFRAGIIDATHTQHILSDHLIAEVQAKFETFQPAGAAPYPFHTPNRIDLLRAI